jgi:hypothetical protein
MFRRRLTSRGAVAICKDHNILGSEWSIWKDLSPISVAIWHKSVREIRLIPLDDRGEVVVVEFVRAIFLSPGAEAVAVAVQVGLPYKGCVSVGIQQQARPWRVIGIPWILRANCLRYSFS